MSAGAWPLSAAATAILRKPRIGETEVLKLTLKELVVRRVWRLAREPARSRWRGEPTVRLAPGSAPVPPLVPLPDVDAALRRAVEDVGPEVRALARRLALDGWPIRVRDAAREDLGHRGLITIERRKVLGLVPRTVVRLTMDGEQWAADARQRCVEAERSIAERAPGAHADVLAMGALVLFVAPPVLAELDDVVLRRPEGGGAGPSTGGTDAEGPDLGLDLDLGALDGVALDDLDVFDSLDTSFDSAFDSGSSGGGDGGGGGGGD